MDDAEEHREDGREDNRGAEFTGVGGSEHERVRRRLLPNPWFAGIPASMQTRLIDAAVVRHYIRGAEIYRQGDRVPGVFVLLSGQVLFEHRMDPSREFILHIGGPLCWFGQAPLVTDIRTENTAVARADTTALLFPANRLRGLLEAQPEMYAWFARLQGRRFLMALVQLAEMSNLTGLAFLKRRLRDLTALNNQDQGKPPEAPVVVALTQEDVAKMIGVSRQTANGYLAELEREGLIQVGFRHLQIPNPEALLRDL